MPFIRTFVTLLAAIGVFQGASAQSFFGIRGSYLHVMNAAAIPIVPGSLDCGAFGNGTSPGWSGAITVDHMIAGPLLEVTGAVVYSVRPAALQAFSADNFEVLDPRTNSFVPLQRQHSYASDLGYVSAEVGLRLRPLGDLPLYIRIAVDAGNALVNAQYLQTERIVSPAGVLFPDGTARRTNGRGDVAGIGTSYGGQAHLGAELAWFGRVTILPEVGFRYGINSLSSAMEWKQSMLVAGLQIRVDLTAEPDLPAEPEPPTAPPSLPQPVPIAEERRIEPEPPVATTAPVQIASLSTNPLEIRETVVTQTFPLLPYVFFDSASASIRDRYLKPLQGPGFQEPDLPRQTLQIYYRLIDVVGRRMATNPGSILTVVGTTDGRELTSVDARRRLAQQRAEAFVNELQQRWKIDASRFVIKTADRPQIQSNDRYSEGMEENRRVELQTSYPQLLAPIVHSRFNEYVAHQPSQQFSVTVQNPHQAVGWSLVISRNEATVDAQRGTGAPPANITFDMSQQLADRLGPVTTPVDSLRAVMTIDQRSSDPVAAQTTFPLRKTTNTFEVSRLSLIVFDFDQSEISATNREMMRQLITTSTRAGSRAVIRGSTDRLGEADHNQALSAARANAVNRYLRTIAPHVAVDDVRGIGASELPYDNALPEGRFYCRTVSLTITTPLR